MFGARMTIILFFRAVMVLVMLLGRWLDESRRDKHAQSSDKNPLDKLKKRSARGEIVHEEFEDRQRALGD